MASEYRVNLSRRSFMQWAGVSGLSPTLSPHLMAQDSRNGDKAYVAEKAVPVSLKINGKTYQLKIEPRVTLLDCLRENLSLTGTKKGCDHGQCGACTIHVNGQRMNACLSLAIMHQGDEITTIEGIGRPEALHPMQKAFVDKDAFQCGYCTPGQIMSACALLKEKCGSSDNDVREAMSGNICRCGAYQNILNAVQTVRGNRRADA